jgi:flagellar basal body-associated protein FliL
MICQQCRAEVDDDLIFCTNCGARLFEPKEQTPTVLMSEPVYQKPESAKPAKSSSNLKWFALIAALVAIPASIFGILLLQSQKRQVAQNAPPPKTPIAAPTRRANTNQNANANSANAANAVRANSNTNVNAANPDKIEIMNKRLEIAPKDHQTIPFDVESETAKISGEVRVIEGEKIDGYVYIKNVYEEHFLDENFKVFSFGTAETTEIRQTLVKEEYVLVFVNKTEKPVLIEGKFSLE